MPQWKGKSRGNRLGYSIFVFLIKTFGPAPAYLLLRFVAFYYLLFSASSSRHIHSYFRHRHGYSSVRSLLGVYHNYYLFGQTLLDKIMVMSGMGSRFTFDFDGEDNLLRMVNGGKGGILISAHVGNWEAAGHLLERLKTPVNVVMYDAEHQRIKDYLAEVTGGRKFKVIVVREDLSHVYAIGEALQRNELVCLHADRFLDGNKTFSTGFLGGLAHFPSGPFMLAATFGVPVSVVFAFKESSSHYHFFGSDLMQRAPGEDSRSFREKLSRTFVQQLEEKTRRYPEQWFNYYNFWAEPSPSQQPVVTAVHTKREEYAGNAY